MYGPRQGDGVFDDMQVGLLVNYVPAGIEALHSS